ncbi:MAG TPA: proton-conducting transporter membrane subunit, partial [Acidimicrobiales bacterium]|nr:proton-conducting transporter membrane subunit [Acidimicrobiales bacterium]
MNAAYVIVALPLIGATLLLFGNRWLREPLSGWIATLMAGGSFAATVAVWATLLGRSSSDRLVDKRIFTWIPVGGLHVNAGLQLDPLSILWCLFVTGVSSLITLYSIGYMHGDRDYTRFFFYLNAFVFSMIVLVLADNFLFSFFGWEGVGFCSYGLVGFWFERDSAAVAAKKAFVTNRVGDFGFMIALFLMFQHFGSVDYAAVLAPLASGAGTLPGAFATGLALMLFLGAVA